MHTTVYDASVETRESTLPTTTTGRGCTSQLLHGDVGQGAFPPRMCTPTAWRFVVPIALVALIILVFMTALDAGLVYWDDDDLLVNNTRYHVLSGENVKWMFTTSYAGHFQPLTWLTYSLDFAVWGMEPLGYHLTNILFHAMTAVTFYFLTRMLLAAATGTEGLTRSKPFVLSAACAAALFALHPLRAESVAWLAERRDVVSGFFYVLAVSCYVRYAMRARCLSREDGHDVATTLRGEPAGRRRLWYAGVSISCVLSLLAKATAMTLPVVLLILDVYPLRRLGGVTGWWTRSAGRVWTEKLPLFVLALAAGVRALAAQAQGASLTSYENHNLLARLAQACYGLTFYLTKTLWPANLGPLYEIPRPDVLIGSRLLLSLAVVVGVAVAAFVWRRRFPAIIPALATYVVVLAPVLGFAQAGPQLVGDRYSYVSCMGLAVLAGAGLLQCFRGNSWWSVGRRRAGLGVLLAAVIAVLQWATFDQADIWRSPLHLWARGVKVSPDSAIAHVNYADALMAADIIDGAAYHYRRGLKLNPNDPVGLHHFADLLERSGNDTLATAYYLSALRVDPGRRRACYSLARLLVDQGRAHDAVDVLRDSIGRHPKAWELIEFMALLLSAYPDDTIRNGEEAVSLALRVTRAKGPDDAQALLTLATALAQANRFDEAVATAEAALAITDRQNPGRLGERIKYRLGLFRIQQPYRIDR